MSYVLRLRPTNKSDSAELLQSYLWDAGATGTSELPSGEIIAGFDDETSAKRAGLSIGMESAGIPWTFTVEKVGPTTWKPFTKTTSITISPGDRPMMIEIEADQVFGHGKHPTTQLMLELLTRMVSHNDRVLDVGTGSGVLGIAAAMLGAHVEAIDIDGRAVDTALRNAGENDVEIECSNTPLADLVVDACHRFEVVVINVLLPVHAELYQDVLKAVSPGGKILMAGFLDSQEQSIRQLYQPFKLVDKNRILDWVGLAVSPTN